MAKKLISIITPVYNEEENIRYYFDEMESVLDNLKDQYDFEFIFTDNCSEDRTFDLLQEQAKKDPRIKVYKFSKNFGFQKSIFTAYSKSKGDAAIEFDCDLQDSPKLLPRFLETWEKGNQIVYGVREKRAEGFLITSVRKIFYRVLSYIGEHEIPVDAGDFMLLDRLVIDSLLEVEDHNIYIRGTVFGFGFKQAPIVYEREARKAGSSKFNLKKLLGLALDGIISQSIVPLRVSTYLGLIISFITFCLIFVYILMKFTIDTIFMPLGFTTTVVFILFGISLNAIFLGIIGEYIARIYMQVKKRPFVIIEKKID